MSKHERATTPPSPQRLIYVSNLATTLLAMDHESLRTASTYLNNLLLARGLLRNSEPIDFVKPSKESRAQIINLVYVSLHSLDIAPTKYINTTGTT